MKSEQELLWLVDTRILKPSDLRDLFEGKKLVDASAVVLSLEDAELIDGYSLTSDVISSDAECAAFERFAKAIEQARGKNGT